MTEDGSASSTHYDVALTTHGYTCSCADFNFARQGRDPNDGGMCKHLLATTKTGLL